jgi:hypothetical protein
MLDLAVAAAVKKLAVAKPGSAVEGSTAGAI